MTRRRLVTAAWLWSTLLLGCARWEVTSADGQHYLGTCTTGTTWNDCVAEKCEAGVAPLGKCEHTFSGDDVCHLRCVP